MAEIVEETPVDIMGMSDADVMSMTLPEESASVSQQEEAVEDTLEEVAEQVADVPSNDIEEVIEEVEETTDEGAPDVDEDTASTDVKDTLPNAAEQLAELFAPFRANNKEMQIDSVEDARTLMQMGANYNKKMASIKPNLKLLKMLENHNLLDEDKLTFLIDLDKKNPAAIKKFLQESKVDPDTLDLEEDADYTPNTYTVSDNEVVLDGILEEIQDTDSFDETINILSNKWDETSKKVLLDQPSIIKHINEHVASGIYEKISTEVTRQKMFGKLNGLSDIEAYKTVGDAMHEAGALDTPASTQASKPKAIVQTSITSKPDANLRSRKKAASSTRTTPQVKKSTLNDVNILALSDEEIMRLGVERFM